MEEEHLYALQARLAGRTKEGLIHGMLSRSPHAMATVRVVEALEVYPLVLLMLAHDHPTKIWLLDSGEKPSSAGILTQRMKQRRWNSARITVDDCDGITDLAPGYIAMVASWKTPFILRHEFAHAATTFLPHRTRHSLAHLYSRAREHGRFTEPLAAESFAEFVACGLSYYYSDDLREKLAAVDPRLYRTVHGFHGHAEALSLRMDSIGSPASEESPGADPVPPGPTPGLQGRPPLSTAWDNA